MIAIKEPAGIRLNTGGKHPARTRYWTKHEKPTKKKVKQLGQARRFARDDRSLLQKIATLASVTEAEIARRAGTHSASILFRVMRDHKSKMAGAIARLSKVRVQASESRKHDQAALRKGDLTVVTGDWIRTMPRRVEAEIYKAAFNARSEE